MVLTPMETHRRLAVQYQTRRVEGRAGVLIAMMFLRVTAQPVP